MARKSEQREFTRVPVSVATELKTGQADAIFGRAEDVSLKGVFVVSSKKFPPRTECSFEFTLPATGDQMVRVKGRGVVARIDPLGMAIEFNELDADSVGHLRNLVLYNAPDAEKVEHEIDGSMGIRKKR